MVRLLQKDVERGAMLLERLTPGTTLVAIQQEDDERATRIAAPVIRDVVVPIPPCHSLPCIADWADVLHRVRGVLRDGPVTLRMVDKAQRIFEDLESSK